MTDDISTGDVLWVQMTATFIANESQSHKVSRSQGKRHNSWFGDKR